MKKLILLIMLLATGLFASININTANIKELTSLPGIGKAKAEAIIKYRKEHSFKNIQDLQKVKGIGKKIFLKIRKQILVKPIPSKIKNFMKR